MPRTRRTIEQRLAEPTTSAAPAATAPAAVEDTTTLAEASAPAEGAASGRSKRLAGAKRQPKNVRARMADVVIRITADQNPHREGTAAHDHFEKMRGGITIREYLAKFSEKDQRVARQWLWNIVKAGHAKTFG